MSEHVSMGETKKKPARKKRSRVRFVIRAGTLAVATAALVKELRTPREEREWHGRVWVVPYDFRVPTPTRVRSALWSPDDPTIFTPRPAGVGWALNIGRLYRLWNNRS